VKVEDKTVLLGERIEKISPALPPEIVPLNTVVPESENVCVPDPPRAMFAPIVPETLLLFDSGVVPVNRSTAAASVESNENAFVWPRIREAAVALAVSVGALGIATPLVSWSVPLVGNVRPAE
jgi:hypothetical protein